jgi:glycosyltransferase involved in cell wall biosynthesis
MNSPLISIIVPVYQVEKYLEKCINSIIAQTYKNLEIILVDDGSTDNCPAICNRFQSEDSRIKVIHQENGGLSHARNVGLEHATGDFIGFVDSDDWIEPNMYEILMSVLQESETDIAVCNRQVEYDDSKPIQINLKSPEKMLYSPEDALRKIFNGGSFIFFYVWNKLYKRNVLANIKFPNGKFHEDILWTTQVLGNAKGIISVDYPLYHYIKRSESLTCNDSMALRRGKDIIEMFSLQIAYIHEHYPNLEKLAIIKFQNTCLREYLNFSLKYHHFDTDGTYRHQLHQYFCQFKLNNILKYDGLKTTLGRILFRFCPNLLVKAYAFRKSASDQIAH